MGLRILISGIKGKMGQMAHQALSDVSDFEVVGGATRQDHLPALIAKCQPDIVVDLTSPEVVFQHTQAIIEAGVHPIIGTTGLTPAQFEQLKCEADKKSLGGLVIPNFSLAAVLLMHYAREISAHFPEVEIIEMHHDKKKDAPSGTALKTAQLIHAQQQLRGGLETFSAETNPARGDNRYHVPIHAIRLPGLLAHQQVIFGNKGETLTLRHDTVDRTCYMPGLILACRQVAQLNSLEEGLDVLLFSPLRTPIYSGRPGC